jgi:hypothetical protein
MVLFRARDKSILLAAVGELSNQRLAIRRKTIPEVIMAEPEKITIIEGPPPTFELVNDPWLLGLTESTLPNHVALCRLRSFNAPELVERCHRAWRNAQTIRLEYRTEEGLTNEAPIVAVRWLETLDGQILLVWVRLEEDEIEFEIDLDDLDDLDDLIDDEDDLDLNY